MPPVKLPPFASRPEENAERAALVDALEKCQGNKAHAARLLGIPRSTLYQRIKDYSIDPSRHRGPRSEPDGGSGSA